MDKIRVIVASVLFILLTAIKLLLPAQMDLLRREAGRLTGMQPDCRSVVAAIGRGLSDGELGEKLVAVFRDYMQEETEER